ncbi:hypothetical protein, variant [Spizellomyces punctatus DAOM BR117]|nr:hypothetical protein, variant [Spizellomyces punctatus DAOM BR117]KND04258.1 hypothetical protein, variant [Spizellomyces punctatus DAOM BR117]|eukprot:XP_016612297.1 hypothetical protein, variant [Spizellomyces punctatus DAOM BR117]
MKPLRRLPPTSLEVSFEDLYAADAIIDIPKRPPWSYAESREVVQERESSYFQKWLDAVYAKYPAEELSYFEHNLEVWRQLWRVAEISDIILFIVDVRHPILHFPPSLYDYVVKDLGRKLILVFNKIDLVGQDTLEAWTNYFRAEFPEISAASFSCYPKDGFLKSDSATAALKSRVRRKYKRYYRAVGVPEVLRACRDTNLVKGGVEVDWDVLIDRAEDERRKREEEAKRKSDEEVSGRRGRRKREQLDAKEDLTEDESQESEVDENCEDADNMVNKLDIEEHEAEPNKNWVTIGLVGHPNVGKSSLINSVIGRKVVSTSRTPGHTKHFQTIHLTSDVRLCDCPGLVFPAIVPKPLQILAGMYRISQVQEPYTSIQYLAERVPLEEILNLHHPDQDDPDTASTFHWSAWRICEAFALDRGFLTARVARPDVYRAANMILRMCVDGRILLGFKPKGFSQGLWREIGHNASRMEKDEERAAVKEEEDDESEEEDIQPEQDGGAFELLAGMDE